MTVRLKLCLLPEREMVVPVLSARRKKLKPAGVDGLTLRELALLKHVGDGLFPQEIRKRWNVTRSCVDAFAKHIRCHMGMHGLHEVARMPHLPLEGRALALDGRPRQDFSKALLEILEPLADGATNKEIAAMKGLSVSTVAGRRARLMGILDAKSTYQLRERAKAMGLM